MSLASDGQIPEGIEQQGVFEVVHSGAVAARVFQTYLDAYERELGLENWDGELMRQISCALFQKVDVVRRGQRDATSPGVKIESASTGKTPHFV